METGTLFLAIAPLCGSAVTVQAWLWRNKKRDVVLLGVFRALLGVSTAVAAIFW